MNKFETNYYLKELSFPSMESIIDESYTPGPYDHIKKKKKTKFQKKQAYEAKQKQIVNRKSILENIIEKILKIYIYITEKIRSWIP